MLCFESYKEHNIYSFLMAARQNNNIAIIGIRDIDDITDVKKYAFLTCLLTICYLEWTYIVLG